MGVGVAGNRMGAGPPPLVRAGGGMGLGAFHPLPPSINMLFNPHHRNHAHSSTATTNTQPGVIPPPTVQRIPATNSQHKNNISNVGTAGPNKSNNAIGQPVCPNIHQKTTASPSQQSKLHHTLSAKQSLPAKATTDLENNHEKTTEGKTQQKALGESSHSSAGRTMNGEQGCADNVQKESDGGTVSISVKTSDENNCKKEQGNSKASEKLAEQGIASVNRSSSNKFVMDNVESEKKSSSGKGEVGGVAQNQTKLKQEIRETGSNKGNDSGESKHTKIQLEKT